MVSAGFGFRAQLVDTDGETAVYRYSTYDLNCEEGRDGFGTQDLDGVLWVFRDGAGIAFEVERHSRYVSSDPHACLGVSQTQRLMSRIQSILEDTSEYPEALSAHY